MLPTRRSLLLAAAAAIALVTAPPAFAGTDTITRVAGGSGSIAAPQPALQIGMQLPEGIAVQADGGYLIADKHNMRILRVRPDGIAVVAAGGGGDRTGEGVPATTARVEYPTDVAVTPDGGFLYVEAHANRVRKVGTDGLVRTVAGNGQLSTGGDGGPATQAGLYYPWSVAVMPDGGFVVSQPYAYKVRRVMPDGTIRTILGNGTQNYAENVPGPQTGTNWPYGLAVKKDGSVLVAEDFGARVRRVRPDGIVERFAGTGTDMGSGISQGSENGKPATEVGLGRLCDIAVAPDDSVIVSQSDCAVAPYESNSRYYLLGRITPDGKYTLFGGNGYGPTYDVEGKHRLQTSFGRVRGLAFTQTGDLLFTENSYYRAYRIDTDLTKPPVVARFTNTPSLVVAGRSFTLDASTSTVTGPATYAWDLDGNGTYERNAGSSATTTHTFWAHGNKTVRLKVTDSRGTVATATRTIAVNGAPSVSFTVTPLSPLRGTTATLDGSASRDPDGSIVKWQWDLNPSVAGYERTSTTSPTTTYAWSTAGTRNVLLRVTDDKGTTSSKTVAVTVR